MGDGWDWQRCGRGVASVVCKLRGGTAAPLPRRSRLWPCGVRTLPGAMCLKRAEHIQGLCEMHAAARHPVNTRIHASATRWWQCEVGDNPPASLSVVTSDTIDSEIVRQHAEARTPDTNNNPTRRALTTAYAAQLQLSAVIKEWCTCPTH